MRDGSLKQDNPSRLRQRLWGAAVLIAIAVIVLPLILDGAGSESQFRQVERLREEPPALETPAATLRNQQEPEMRSVDVAVTQEQILESVISKGSAQGTDNDALLAEKELREGLSGTAKLPLTAWVVQAASFAEEQAAIELRDQLRKAGFASFVRDREAQTGPFRVLVGPMIKSESAEKARLRVAAMLQNDPIILTYP